MFQILYRDNGALVLRSMARLAVSAEQVGPVLQDVGERMVNFSIPENFKVGGRPTRWPGSRSPQTQVDTGRLLRSITFRVTGTSLELGTNVKYAAQRQHGGVIKARGKKLAIPVKLASKTRNRPKHYPNLKWAPDKGGGRLVETVKRGKKTVLVTRFLLRDQVTQEPRPFLLHQRADLEYAQRALLEHLTRGFRE